MNEIVNKVMLPILKDDKIYIPEQFKKVKLDVGLSMNAPHPEIWLSNEEGLLVIGFEPSSLCHDSFINKNEEMSKKYPGYTFINTKRLFKTFFPLKCALSNKEPHYQKFYNTGNDLGCSSLYKPVSFPIINIEEVPVITLKDFFDIFPWDQISYIDQLKIDAQGSDYEILLGAGDCLNRIVYITVENTVGGHYEKEDDYYKFEGYLKNFNFKKIDDQNGNSTFINTNHLDKKINFFVFNL